MALASRARRWRGDAGGAACRTGSARAGRQAHPRPRGVGPRPPHYYLCRAPGGETPSSESVHHHPKTLPPCACTHKTDITTSVTTPDGSAAGTAAARPSTVSSQARRGSSELSPSTQGSLSPLALHVAAGALQDGPRPHDVLPCRLLPPPPLAAPARQQQQLNGGTPKAAAERSCDPACW